MTLSNGEELGIVDVPGHRDFIENMLSGVGAIDAALFVVAADEGVMPQSREHLAILDLLQVRGGVVALTKLDVAEDEDWLDLVEADLLDVLEGTVLDGAPVLLHDELLPVLRVAHATDQRRAAIGEPHGEPHDVEVEVLQLALQRLCEAVIGLHLCDLVVDARTFVDRFARTLDEIKFRTMAGFGRCQGGFCTSRVIQIMAEELNISPLEITKKGKGSYFLTRESGNFFTYLSKFTIKPAFSNLFL